jgi:hypothetical protein
MKFWCLKSTEENLHDGHSAERNGFGASRGQIGPLDQTRKIKNGAQKRHPAHAGTPDAGNFETAQQQTRSLSKEECTFSGQHQGLGGHVGHPVSGRTQSSATSQARSVCGRLIGLVVTAFFDRTTVKAKKHQGVQIPLNAALAACLVLATFDATARFTGSSSRLKWRAIFFGQIPETGLRYFG